MCWATGYLRLSPRFERRPSNRLASFGLAAALRCYKRRSKPILQDAVHMTMPNRLSPADHQLVNTWRRLQTP